MRAVERVAVALVMVAATTPTCKPCLLRPGSPSFDHARSRSPIETVRRAAVGELCSSDDGPSPERDGDDDTGEDERGSSDSEGEERLGRDGDRLVTGAPAA